ncbi:hypothetical protein G3580_01045 [Nitrogeniibacter mangrovi]|uniref:Protein NosL n=1 Tax=Nitrogeniibacter mangrovi TaxID=2016596 RepID=A0A6C1B297_9RHOO|nr:hypothetical protein [Nitrogeniibacter mangrovi]QID16334.1 hypothetical protein G3580_01045 [Nitrogeniibacter mangrovi]
MNRRHFFRQAAALATVPLTGFGLTACSEVQPARLALNETHCEYCKAAITQRPFAAQVRDAGGATHFFDDFGCAVRWIQGQDLPESRLHFWVMDYHGGYWVDAFKAHYHGGTPSPQGYNLTASTIPGGPDMSYPAARDAVLARPA